MANSFNIVNIW